MTLLPIVERELRVASRKRLTFWGRVGVAGIALAIFFGLQLLAGVSRGGFKAGEVQFAFLKWTSFAFACSAGIFLTSDSLSEEKREGTLGLLFLTDLRGHDVALGKLISHSLQSFYGLIAAIPILGLTMLAGGVAGGEFWHAMLVISNTLFLSLCAGLFISSISRDVMKAMNGTLFLLLLILAGTFLIDACIARWQFPRFQPILSYASPGFLFYQTGPYLFREYWTCLGVQHGLAWLFLILACICAPRAWQDQSNQNSTTHASFSQVWRFGSVRFRARLRRRLLERQPIYWLAVRDRWMTRFTWCVLGIGLVVLAWALIYFQNLVPLKVAAYLQILFGFGLMLWIASSACRFFVDGIRTGAFELVLVTPVTPAVIIRSEWKALLRAFFFPAMLLVAINVAGSWVFIWEIMKIMWKANSPPNFSFAEYQIATLCVGVVKLLGNLAAVAWFGMLMGTTTRKTSLAIFKTICFVIVLPAIALNFGQGLMMGFFMLVKLPVSINIGLAGVLNLAKNIFFIVYARQRLFTTFREAMLREGQMAVPAPRPVPPQAPPPLAPPPLPPPIIPAGARTN
jgi:hypothetical protein